MGSFLDKILYRIKPKTVYSLIGKSGTGKSFRAALVAEKYKIDILVDDGLIIRDQKILAGKSAKREKAYLKAVKTALFSEKDHRREALHCLAAERFQSILILGTSDRMVKKICANLELPVPAKTIRIEEVATSDEIQTAINYRHAQGMHVIPVPSIEVKKNYPRIMADSIKVFLQKRFGLIRKSKVFEKTVVRPQFSKRGKVVIAESALTQMVLHCVEEYAPSLKVQKVSVRNEPHGYKLNIYIEIPYGVQMAGTLQTMQRYILESIEKYTGVVIETLNITVNSVGH